MKNLTISLAALLSAFIMGFALNSFTSQSTQQHQTMKKVTGIGGIFFKCKDPQKMTAWYREHLGLDTNPYGATFEWYEDRDNNKKAQTQWSPFAENTNYFEPGEQDFMINYRVENLEALVDSLRAEGVAIVDEIATYDYGKFIHILDAEGNKVELWEPIGE